MHPRYNAPFAQDVFCDYYVVQAWASYTKQYMLDLVEEEDMDARDAIATIPIPDFEAVRTREQNTGHEVVAFLELFIANTPVNLVPLVHYGLTSSDLTENTLHLQLRTHAHAMLTLVSRVQRHLRDHWIPITGPRPGRTHGQLAEITSWGNQTLTYLSDLDDIYADLSELAGKRLNVTKWPGPVGTSRVGRTPLPAAVPSTQVIPRDRLLQWVALYARLVAVLENLALLVRTGSRAEIAEVHEGAASTRAGSSAMPHKKNPIDSEKVCGLARVARGHVATLLQTSTWDDRDLSNSSQERISVGDLAAVVEHMITTMDKVICGLHIHVNRMNSNAQVPECWSNFMQSAVQEICKISSIRASMYVKQAFEREYGSFTQTAMMAFRMQVLWNIITIVFGEDQANQVYDRVMGEYKEMTVNG